MKLPMNLNGLLRTGIVILLLVSCVQVVGASSRDVPFGGVVYIGETGLNVSLCVFSPTIGWWPNPADVNVTSPSRMLTVPNPRFYNISPEDYTDYTGFHYTGTWYNVDSVSGRPLGMAFVVADPLPATPVARNDSYSLKKNTVLRVPAPGVLANDYDPDGGTLSAVKVTSPRHGKLVLNADGSFTYTPVKWYIGSDTFSYRASDGSSSSDTAIVSLSIRW